MYVDEATRVVDFKSFTLNPQGKSYDVACRCGHGKTVAVSLKGNSLVWQNLFAHLASHALIKEHHTKRSTAAPASAPSILAPPPPADTVRDPFLLSAATFTDQLPFQIQRKLTDVIRPL